MKWNSLILSLSLAAGVAVAHPPMGIAQSARENSDALKLFMEGNELYLDGNFPDAEKKFREALSKYPKSGQPDRTTYYLIITLEKLRRFQDARREIENFYRSYPGSRWRGDVDEKNLALGGLGTNELLAQEQKIARERAAAERAGTTALPPNASMEAEALRKLIQLAPDRGIEKARELLNSDPSDPVVVANLGTIFSSNSPQALSFLLNLYANASASPNARNTAFFFAMRRNPDRVQVANTLMEMLGKKENEKLVSGALFSMTFTEHRAVLEKIVGSSNPDKFDAIEKIYQGGSITLRTDLLMAVAKLKDDPRAEAFITDAAQNDKDLVVRRAALEALIIYKGREDVGTLEKMLSPLPTRRPATLPGRGTAPATANPTIPAPPPAATPK